MHTENVIYIRWRTVRKRERENSRRFINVKIISIEILELFALFTFVLLCSVNTKSLLVWRVHLIHLSADMTIALASASRLYTHENLSARFGSQLLHRLLIAKLICTYTYTLPTRCTRSHITCILIGVGFEIGNIENKRWSLKQILFVCIRINK